MAKKRKPTKPILDPFAFKGLEKLEVVFPTQVPDYNGTPMTIVPKIKKHK